MLPRVSFPRVFRRTPVVNSLPVTLAPTPPDTAPQGAEAGGNSASTPANHRVISRDAGAFGRQAINIEDGLNSGPVPNRIDVGERAKNAGAIGPGMASWPYDANREYMAHTAIPRYPGNVTPYVKTIDTGVTIPAIEIGTSL